MRSISLPEYVAVFVATTAGAALLTPVALRLALRRSMVDAPGPIKAQRSPVPYLGGMAILLSFCVVVLAMAAVSPEDVPIGELGVILGLAVLLALVGLVDDIRTVGPWIRLVVEAAAGVVVWATPAGAELFDNDALDLGVTVFWILTVTNAFNLLDNMDGLSAGVASIAALFCAFLAADNGQVLVATLAVALAGCSLGFLRSNFHPARIYMGDAGALFIGFVLAVLALKLDFHGSPKGVALGVPVVLLAVPLADAALVVVNRLLHHRSPMSGGRDHASHRLVFIGLRVPVAVTLIYLTAISVGCLALVLSRVKLTAGLLLMGWIGALGLGLLVLLSMVPVYETSRRRHLMLQEVAPHDPELEAEVTAAAQPGG